MILTDYLNAVRRGWPIVLVAVVLGVLASSIYTLRAPLEFNSDSSLLISAVGSGSPQDRQAGDSFASARAGTYAALATSQEVLQPAAAQLSGLTWQELRSRITAVVQDGTSVISLRAVDDTATAAAAEADAVTSALVDRVEEIESAPSDSDAAGGGRFEVRVIQDPQPAVVALYPQPRNNLIAGLIAGFVIGVVAALIRGSLVNVVTDMRSMPRRGLSFDLTAGSRRGGRAARRQRRADLFVTVLGRRLGPRWTVLLVGASANANAAHAADVVAEAAAQYGSTLVVRVARGGDAARRGRLGGEIESGGAERPDLLELRAHEVEGFMRDWRARTAEYAHVLVACASDLRSADVARLLTLSGLTLLTVSRNATRVTELRTATKDLEFIGADQILTLLDER